MISIHRIQTIEALYISRPTVPIEERCNWLEINFGGGHGEATNLTLYCNDPALAARIAAAINSLNAGPQVTSNVALLSSPGGADA